MLDSGEKLKKKLKMAARDDSPTSLHGQPWSVWADRLGRDSPLSDNEDCADSIPVKEGDAMKLPKKDMSYYGLCPVRDEFYLVTCNYCQRVCTPQGLKNHIELKHSQEWQPQPLEPLDGSVISNVQGGPQVTTVSTKVKANGGKKVSSGTVNACSNSLAALLSSPTVPTTKQPRTNKRGTGSSGKGSGSFSHGSASSKIPTALSSALTGTPYDKIPSPQQPPPSSQSNSTAQFSPLQPTLTAPSPVSPLTTGAVLMPSPAITMTVAVDSSGVQTVQIHLPEIANGVMLPSSPTDLVEAVAPSTSNAASTGGSAATQVLGSAISRSKKRKSSKSERRLLPLKEREFDAEKHCGVWMSDIQKPCTRSLTCKAHSLTLRRAVQGRSRSFDDLLADHRAAKELLVRQLKEGSSNAANPVKNSPLSPVAVKPAAQTVPVKPRPLVRPGPPSSKKSSLNSLLQPSSTSELTVDVASTEASSNQQTPSGGLLQRAFPAPNPSVASSCSLSFTTHHPRPLAVCSFGLRRNRNPSNYPNYSSYSVNSIQLDRKWDLIRTALRSAFQAKSKTVTTNHFNSRPAVSSGSAPSLLRNSNHQSGLSNSRNIELPNGLQLSIGLKPEANRYSDHFSPSQTDLTRFLLDKHNGSNHRVRLKNLTNGLNAPCEVQQQAEQETADLMDGFDGLVGEDGVLTFVNQGSEGSASLSLMADLSAGNITFSDMLSDSSQAAAAAAAAAAMAAAASGGGITLPSTTLSHTHAPPPPGPLPPRILLQSPTGAGLIFQPDPGDQMMM